MWQKQKHRGAQSIKANNYELTLQPEKSKHTSLVMTLPPAYNTPQHTDQSGHQRGQVGLKHVHALLRIQSPPVQRTTEVRCIAQGILSLARRISSIHEEVDQPCSKPCSKAYQWHWYDTVAKRHCRPDGMKGLQRVVHLCQKRRTKKFLGGKSLQPYRDFHGLGGGKTGILHG